MSEIITDKLTGRATANDVTVTAGATATMSLEQGLTKTWIVFGDDANSTQVVDDSLNISSLTDNAGGDQTDNFTNNMATAKAYTIAGSMCTNSAVTNYQYIIQPREHDDIRTNLVRMLQIYGNNVGQGIADYEYVSHAMHGDLA